LELAFGFLGEESTEIDTGEARWEVIHCVSPETVSKKGA
jgi:hypothetical protein